MEETLIDQAETGCLLNIIQISFNTHNQTSFRRVSVSFPPHTHTHTHTQLQIEPDVLKCNEYFEDGVRNRLTFSHII